MPDTQDKRSSGFDLRAVNQTVIAEYRATGGALQKTLPGSRLVLLTTAGRRTGRDHTTPLGYVTDPADPATAAGPGTSPSPDTAPSPDTTLTLDVAPRSDGAQPADGAGSEGDSGRSVRPERIVVFASNMAATSDPDWYRNLTANPKVIVELGSDRFEAAAETVSGAERARLHQALVDAMPGLHDHQDRTEREIPVVVLAPLR